MALSVLNALEHWEKEGLLTKKKADELRSSLPDADSNNAIRIFSALGAILIGLGVDLDGRNANYRVGWVSSCL